MLMAYDEHALNSPTPGPVASISFVERSIKQLLADGVPPQKIVLAYHSMGASGTAMAHF